MCMWFCVHSGCTVTCLFVFTALACLYISAVYKCTSLCVCVCVMYNSSFPRLVSASSSVSLRYETKPVKLNTYCTTSCPAVSSLKPTALPLSVSLSVVSVAGRLTLQTLLVFTSLWHHQPNCLSLFTSSFTRTSLFLHSSPLLVVPQGSWGINIIPPEEDEDVGVSEALLLAPLYCAVSTPHCLPSVWYLHLLCFSNLSAFLFSFCSTLLSSLTVLRFCFFLIKTFDAPGCVPFLTVRWCHFFYFCKLK